jgi:putative transposase
MVHVDSTKFDERCTPDFLSSLGFDCPTLYLAMDSATGRPLGRAILFGPACRNALAVLIRDILYRQGFLPRYWNADGGSEYIGPWLEGFCSLTGATRIQPPAGNPRKNSLAENALGRVNAELAHRFLGSTAPDKQGRSVTSRQKSYATACHKYSTVVEHLDRYLFDDMPTVPHGAARFSAQEKSEYLTELFGNVGTVSIANMDDFLIATSIPIERDISVDPVRGIRYLRRTYVSTELMRQIRLSRVIEKRLDCVNPRRMYVRFPERWVLAMASDHQITAGQSDLVTLFEIMTDSRVRSENEAIRKAKRIARTLEIQRANEVAGSTKHLQAISEPTPATERHIEEDANRSLWSMGEMDINRFRYEGEEE